MKFLRFAAAAALAVLATSAWSQAYPNKPVRMIVGFPPGGGTDVVARVIGAKLQEWYGQPVVVENRPGATGTIGADFVAKSAADGYTLIMGHVNSTGIAPNLFAKLPYDPIKDFAAVSYVGYVPNVLAVHPSVPASNVKEFIELAKAKPGGITIASSGNGSSAHLGAELFKMLTGVNLLHVPYKGAAPALNDVIGGHANAMLVDIAVAMPHAKAGRVKVLGIGSPKRFEGLPEVPTIAESGVPGFEVSGIIGLMFPAGAPKEAIEKVNAAVNKSLTLPQVQERLRGLATIPVGGPPERLSEAFRIDIEKWGRVIRAGNIKPD